MNKNVIKITESELKQIVVESVKKVLNESNIWNQGDGVIKSVYGINYELISDVFYALNGPEADRNELEMWYNTILHNARNENSQMTQPKNGRFTKPKYMAKLDKTINRNMRRLKK